MMNESPPLSLFSLSGPLELRNIDDRAFRQIASGCQASVLRLYHLSVKALEGIENLRTVSDLTLHWATKITSLKPVFGMTWLRRLEIFDLPRLKDIEGIEALTELNEFSANGGMGKPLRLASLSPLAALSSLTRFTLINAQITDDDITVLAKLPRLRHLNLSNQFEREQVAFLAKKLNPQLETPLSAHVETHLACAQCGTLRCMFTGRRIRNNFLCRQCEPARFEKLANEFQRLVDAA